MSGHEDCSAGRSQHMGSSGMKRRYGEKKGLGGQKKLKAVIAKTTTRAASGHGVDVRHVQGVMGEGGEVEGLARGEGEGGGGVRYVRIWVTIVKEAGRRARKEESAEHGETAGSKSEG